MWQAWQIHGALPSAGGWLDQPLDVLVAIRAINTVHSTFKSKAEGENWSKFSLLQKSLITWLENGN